MGCNLTTIFELMSSNSYKDRFRAEYMELLDRFYKLRKMLEKWDNGTLDFIPTCPRSTYDMQIRAMSDYLAILEARAIMEGIDIEEVKCNSVSE